MATHTTMHVEVSSVTGQAALLKFPEQDDEELWVPLSLIDNPDDLELYDGEPIALDIAKWFLKKNGVSYD